MENKKEKNMALLGNDCVVSQKDSTIAADALLQIRRTSF